jgi:hypothetical protein
MTPKPLRHLAWLFAVLTLACGGLQESAPSASLQGSTTVLVASTTQTTASTTMTSLSTASTVEGPIDLTTRGDSELQPGTYSVDPDGSPTTSPRAEFTLAEPGWGAFRGVYKDGPPSLGTYVAVKFLTVTRVASPACDSTVFVPIGDTAEDLASALGGIEDFVVQEAPTTVSAYGYDGYHLVLEVPDQQGFLGCDDGYFDGYEGPTIGRYYQGPGQVVEFWVLDVEGTPLVIEATWFPDSPAEDVASLRAILDTVVIRP